MKDYTYENYITSHPVRYCSQLGRLFTQIVPDQCGLHRSMWIKAITYDFSDYQMCCITKTHDYEVQLTSHLVGLLLGFQSASGHMKFHSSPHHQCNIANWTPQSWFFCNIFLLGGCWGPCRGCRCWRKRQSDVPNRHGVEERWPNIAGWPRSLQVRPISKKPCLWKIKGYIPEARFYRDSIWRAWCVLIGPQPHYD